jgi:hypothetical protein
MAVADIMAILHHLPMVTLLLLMAVTGVMEGTEGILLHHLLNNNQNKLKLS